MADLVKGVLGGTWSLIVGWILPVFLFLQLVAGLVLPEVRKISAVGDFLGQTVAVRQAALLATAVVAGIVAAAAQAPLYRVLEGTSRLWPAKLAGVRRKAHQQRRNELVAAQQQAAATDDGIRSGLLYERAARYPVKDKQFAPTAFGNAVRRFETYAGDRFQLDSQLLWHDLTAAAPDSAVTAVDRARTNVDFFVSLVWGGAAAIVTAVAAAAYAGLSVRLGVALGAGLVVSAVAYRLAVLATDEWAAAVRAVVHSGRGASPSRSASRFRTTSPTNGSCGRRSTLTSAVPTAIWNRDPRRCGSSTSIGPASRTAAVPRSVPSGKDGPDGLAQ